MSSTHLPPKPAPAIAPCPHQCLLNLPLEPVAAIGPPPPPQYLLSPPLEPVAAIGPLPQRMFAESTAKTRPGDRPPPPQRMFVEPTAKTCRGDRADGAGFYWRHGPVAQIRDKPAPTRGCLYA